MRVLDLFSGIGGFALGLERAGMQTVAFCEVDKKCCNVLRRHWPEVPIYDDVRTINSDRLAADGIAVDVVCGGFPCQPFSRAARGRNNAPDLWPHMLRIVCDVRPDWVIAENVPGLGHGGVERVCGDLERAAYRVWPFDLDTAPPGRHRGRKRLVFVAYANGDGKSRRAVNAEVAGISHLPRCSEEDDAAPVGMDDGLPGRMDALQQLGNSMSPWAAEKLGRAIMNVNRQTI